MTNGRITPTTYKKTYSNFGGVDFTSAVTEVDEKRSPDALNMISNQAGFPQKRTGYVTLNTFDSAINGIFQLNVNSEIQTIVHAGENLYKTDFTESTLLFSNMNNSKSTAFVHGGKLYILDGKNYISYDGQNADYVDGYVPTTVISATPSGGGKDYETINLISTKRINQFIGTETAKEYQLDATNIDSVYKCETLNLNGEWIEKTDYKVNKATGVVTFVQPPGTSPVEGYDNVKITFSKLNSFPTIEKCTIFSFYGVGGDNRVFVSGNPDKKNRDWQSGSNDPTYFPETQYTEIGADNCAIIGYIKQFNNLIIIKESGDQDATIYIRSTSEDGSGNTIFPVTQGLSGIGAISKMAFGVLYDDPMFLSKDGVFSLDSNKVSLQHTVQLRSYYINARLINEPSLKDAHACVDGRFFYLFINNHVYVADAIQRNQNKSNSYGYEWYYWDNIPARVSAVLNDTLYFGTDDGRVCMFKKESVYGMEAYSDDGNAINAYWTTKKDTLGDASSFKKIKKRNIGILAMPFPKTSGRIYYIGDVEKNVKDYTLSNVFDFDNIDFDNFSFGEDETPVWIPCNKKAKKIKLFQIKVENTNKDESFGIHEIGFKYIISNAIKR